MVYPERLIAIGYWQGSDNEINLPCPGDMVDRSWDKDQSDFLADYLSLGLFVRGYGGYSQ